MRTRCSRYRRGGCSEKSSTPASSLLLLILFPSPPHLLPLSPLVPSPLREPCLQRLLPISSPPPPSPPFESHRRHRRQENSRALSEGEEEEASPICYPCPNPSLSPCPPSPPLTLSHFQSPGKERGSGLSGKLSPATGIVIAFAFEYPSDKLAERLGNRRRGVVRLGEQAERGEGCERLSTAGEEEERGEGEREATEHHVVVTCLLFG